MTTPRSSESIKVIGSRSCAKMIFYLFVPVIPLYVATGHIPRSMLHIKVNVKQRSSSNKGHI